MLKQPVISVVIPVYNTEKYLACAIESVLDQKGNFALDLIVLDDGSTDKTAEIAKSFGNRLRYIYQTNSGISATRNAGIKAAQGDFIAFLDADDYWTENKLSLQIHAFEMDTSLDIVFGQIQQFLSPELSPEAKAKLVCDSKIMPGYHASTLMIRKESLSKVGFFNPELKAGEFLDWYDRAKKIGLNISVLPELLAMRRLHETNYGIVQRKVYGDYFKMLKLAMDRKKNS